ncbi:hypothetical protein [Actinoplanes sp. NPDC049265]|uniref:hypothetical protein n=1 Tax=Actinoplanes sp. NPDC049265 TaxID=3363902 RepID=UPI00371BB191
MRRAAVVVPLILAALWVAAPAQAFAHNEVHSPALHAVLDGLTLIVVTAPVWTVVLWSRGNKWLLAGLIAVVQIPVAVIAMMPIDNPVVHLTLFALALALTAISLRIARVGPAAGSVRAQADD